MAPDELRSTVERVGDRFDLGEYEIDAYLTVLEQGQLTASEIADRTEIPQPRVYDTVRSLSDRDLVELRESRPMKVVALDPSEAFDDVQNSLEQMIDELEARYTAPARDTEAVSLVKSRSTILRYLEEVIDAAEYELSLSLTPDLLIRFEAELEETIADGVSVDLIVTPRSEAPDPSEFDYLSVATSARARRGITTPVVAVADGNYSVYATQDALRDDQDRYGVIFNRSALGFLVSGFFGTVLWTTAEQGLAEDGASRSYPRKYASIRRCVKDVIDEGGEFYATIDGRDVEVGSTEVVRGQVLDVSFEISEEVASMTIETEDGQELTVGGRVAALEDIEAHQIHIGRQEPPSLEK
ncbi:HTH-type sugar sensing transcriptional regulator TrmB [Natronobacterium gregoryi]|uniref:Transcriptional regulator n=2 Tax=Natronobacterium gregoryi TaxID=44930 RepID=L0AP72_NATGS|nr:TrmB family transcriptional regulator [Natronobacterium gregoryi]AFZ74905.1 putative transcriptional regulator [Natronobacterium gregoryi SP2]ELY67602.1 transcriptional regulator TrmB [Natronobacterium gregoryi SP2]PLK18273.1 ArsR family transcriptional regulator [Natronobacterium gregoryi SP2]SFJ72719.1 Sugar-specific transcriptional regulator TrmB [Natronobacterium gregoryi]